MEIEKQKELVRILNLPRMEERLPAVLAFFNKPDFKAHLAERGLSRQEIKVALAATGGASNQELANEFFVSEKTIRGHFTSIFKKLSLKNRRELIILKYKYEGAI